MSNARAEWVTLDIAGSGLRLRYPVTTPEGHRVEVDQLRVHARTFDSRDVYFEVSKEHGVTAQQQYERERGALGRAPVVPEMSDLDETTVAGFRAYHFAATWPDRERVFTYIEKDGVLFRFVYDPRSPINLEIFESLELL